MNPSLTQKQKAVLDFIRESMAENGRPPTLPEIGRRFRVYSSAAQYHVASLVEKGFLRREKATARGISLTAKGGAAQAVGLPLLGAVPAGSPKEAIENAEERFSLDRSMGAKADYILRVKGDSMEPEIEDGDLVLVKKAESADNGEIVVAHAAGAEATVKRLRRKGRAFYLEATNPKYAPITKEFRVIGKVVGLVRAYAK